MATTIHEEAEDTLGDTYVRLSGVSWKTFEGLSNRTRGGRLTYHGPGQRIAYVMLDLKRRGGDVRAFVKSLEDWIIGALGELGVRGQTRPDRIGVWVARPDKGDGIEDKIAAIGLRVTQGVSLHGISLNVAPDLAHYGGIVPCGIAGHGVTSLADRASDIL